jgi:hypothetical protein
MTELELLTALPPPGEDPRTVALPNLAAHTLAHGLIANLLIEGELHSVLARAGGEYRRTLHRGRLTARGQRRLAELEALAA